jgi:hypothetical protein
LDGEDNPPEIEDRYTAGITSTPIPTLSQSVLFTRTEQREKLQGGEIDIRRDDNLFYSITGEIFRNFRLGTEATWSRTFNLEESEPSSITAQVLFRVDAVLRRDLRISGDYAYGWDREGVQRAQSRISNGEFFISYRPTPRLNTQAQYDFLDEGNNRGLEQTYRFSWTAFTGGTLDCTVDFELTKDTKTNELTRRGGIIFIWKPKRSVQMDIQYNAFREDVDVSRLERQTVSGTFTMRF